MELIENKLKKYNQEHIMEILNTLNASEREKLINQILDIDFEQISDLYKSTKQKQEIKNSEITPIDYVDKEKIADAEKEELKKIGENIIKNNQYAVVTMAGGQGTRLGFDAPKGTFKLPIGENGKYIFEILADNLKKSQRDYNILPYWYIMTSVQNNDDTVRFFETHNYFGYDKNKVKFFKQGVLPMLTEEGKLIIENNQIKTASDGNGGVYKALKKEKMLEDMKNKNIKWVFICGVDNIMVNPIDPIFIGLTIKKHMPIASKSIVKAYPEEKIGAFCKRNGKPSIIEYIELTDEMRNARNKVGDLVYGESHFVSNLLSLDAIEEIAKHNLKYHLAIKNNLYKFESFIFDGFEILDDMLVMRVKREEEFAPIKNKDGIDSPYTAIEIYKKRVDK